MYINTCVSGIISLFLLTACQSGVESSSNSQNMTSHSQYNGSIMEPEKLNNVIATVYRSAGKRFAIHLNHACDLIIDDNLYSVLDVRNLNSVSQILGKTSRILVLNADYQLVHQIEYQHTKPVSCEGDTLYFYDAMQGDGYETAENTLQFELQGYELKIRNHALSKHNSGQAQNLGG